MEIKKIIFLVALMTLPLSSSASPDMRRPMVPVKIAERTENIGPSPIKRDLIVVAENEQAVAESKSQAVTDKSEGASDSGSESTENSSRNSDKTETKPLKPFVPSEEIAAEQAVDFPVDI